MEHGPFAFLGYCAVCLLVGTAVLLLLATVGRRTGGPPLSAVVLLIAASVTLQALPATEAGLQFIPLLPWQCSGLVGICISILCWIGLLLAALIAITGCLDAPGLFSAVVLFVMGMNLAVVVWQWRLPGTTRTWFGVFDDLRVIEVASCDG